VALGASHLQKHGILVKISACVRFARRRFGRSDVRDVLAVLFGYAVSGERTVETFSESVQPCAVPFLAVFGRASLPAASTLSRFLAALPTEPVEALRAFFLSDLLARRLGTEESGTGGGIGRRTAGLSLTVTGCVPHPANVRSSRRRPQHRVRPLCAPGFTGRTRGDVGRTRTPS